MRDFQVPRNHETLGAQHLNSYENSKFSSLEKVKVSRLWYWSTALHSFPSTGDLIEITRQSGHYMYM